MNGAVSRQLPLPVARRDGNTLEAFLPAVNPEALAAVQALVAGREPVVYLWGPPDSGRSHLLEAAVAARDGRGGPAFFLAAEGLAGTGPGLLEGLVAPGVLVAIDEIDRFAGDRRWEEAFFHLFNAVSAAGGSLLTSAAATPDAAGFVLADLSSRLSSGLVSGLRPLDDAGRLSVLVFRAGRRGLLLPPEVARFLLTRSSRRLADLVALLDELERAASVSKRRLTLPFVRSVIEG